MLLTKADWDMTNFIHNIFLVRDRGSDACGYVRSTSIWVRVWAGLLETRFEKAETETGTETIDSAHRAAKKMENFWGFDLA